MYAPIRLGDKGPIVVELRRLLKIQGILIEDSLSLDEDDTFDLVVHTAVCTFQQSRGLLVDGIVDEATFRSLRESQYSLGTRDLYYNEDFPLCGDDVSALQVRLQKLGFYTESIDGLFGLFTYNGLCSYQKEFGLSVDGICGPLTVRSLNLLGLNIGSVSAHAIKEFERTRDLGPYLSGKIITLDPGSSVEDRKKIIFTNEGPFSYTDLLWDIALRTAKQLSLVGAVVIFSRNELDNPSDHQRCTIANENSSHLSISLRFASYSNEKAHGVASFYYGNNLNSHSPLGKRLSMYLQKEIAARTPLHDCRYHERTWEILRLTKMPSVLIDLAYMTNQKDTHIISASHYRQAISEAIVVSVKRLFLLGKNELPTGTYNFDALLNDESIQRFNI